MADRLDQALHAASEALVLESPDVWPAVRTHIEPRRQRSYGLRPALAGLLGLLVVAMLLIPNARAAIADWLGIGVIGIDIVDELKQSSSNLELSDAMTIEEAASHLDGVLYVPADLPAPDAVHVGPAGSVWMVWAASDELPETRIDGVGLVITQIPGEQGPVVSKQVPADATIEILAGGTMVWIEGAPHIVQFPDDQRRMAGDTLLVTKGDHTVRIESALGREAAIALAGELELWSSTAR